MVELEEKNSELLPITYVSINYGISIPFDGIELLNYMININMYTLKFHCILILELLCMIILTFTFFLFCIKIVVSDKLGLNRNILIIRLIIIKIFKFIICKSGKLKLG